MKHRYEDGSGEIRSRTFTTFAANEPAAAACSTVAFCAWLAEAVMDHAEHLPLARSPIIPSMN